MARLLTPRSWGIHALAVTLAVAAVLLGLWQYDVWQAKRTEQAVDLTRQQPVPLASVLGPDDPFPTDDIGRPVVLDGTWVPGGTVAVSGRDHDGATGYWVVTPLAIGSAGAPAVPVVRGWVAAPEEAPQPPTGQAHLVGWLQAPEGSSDADPDPADDVLPRMRTADLIQHVDQDLYGGFVIAAGPEAMSRWPGESAPSNAGSQGLAPVAPGQLPSADRFTAVRNLLYALEWLFFAGFALVVWVRWMRDEVAAERTARSGPATHEPVASGP